VYSYVGIGIIGMLFFTLFLLADKSATLINSLRLSKKAIFASLLISTAIYSLFAFFILNAIFVHLLLPVGILIIVFLIIHKKIAGYSFANIIVVITLFAFFSAYLLSIYSTQKEHKERQVLADKLSNNEDPVAELLYANLESQLLNDKVILHELRKPELINKEAIDKRLTEQYFSGYFSKYSLRSYIFLGDGTPLSPIDPDKRKHKKHYFETLLQKNGQPTLSSNYHYIDNAEENENYVASIPLMDSLGQQARGIIYITFESKLIPEEIGFPELLLDTKAKLHEDLSNYSFAKYRDNKLERQFGDYSYGMNPSAFGQNNEKYSFAEIDDYSHIIYKAGNRFLVVLSKPKEGFVGSITTFSYLFAFFSLFLVLLLIGRNVSRGFLYAKLNFNNKIQLLLVAVILTSLVLFGIGTSYYINKQYKEKNYKNISEKINSVLIEVEHKLGEQQVLDEGLKDYMAYILTKFSSVFFTDINLYDLNGNLLATSRPQLFEAGLISRKMNPSAFSQMAAKHKSEFVHDEKIGKLNYLSAYVPFKNQDGEILAYLNLPYFAKQNELENEISSFLVALINIYVFLFAISVVAALMISNFITQPLRLIQSMLSKIELGKTNKPIEYDKKDEIGTLVAVYNKKVDELQKSAELLAKSERESAWREMAKQVAHEIKNPLTPMKLSVQHLKQSWDDKAPDWEEKLYRFTATIIEQIDTLSSIASEFSNFAQMPKARKDKLNIKFVIDSILELYKDTPNLDIYFTVGFKEEIFVLADKDQLLRVLNNLVKNSIQAIPENRTGKIQLRLDAKDEHLVIEVQDNGIGIGPEKVEDIFTPNFTSKTGGMGLGLAMVKNIVENTNGKVWFESRENIGTTFYVKLPQYNEG